MSADYGMKAFFPYEFPEIILSKINDLPQRETTVSSVRYAADRLQTDVAFTDEALAMLVKVPRVFLPTVLKGCVKWAEENHVKRIDVEQMKIINDERSKEKK